MTESIRDVNHTTPENVTDFHHLEALDMVRLDGRGSVKATCKVRLGSVLITGVKIIVPTLASKAFVAMPSRKAGDNWESIVTVFDPVLQTRISDTVIAAWRSLITGGAR